MSTQKEEPSNLDKEQSWRHHTPDIRIYHKAALRHRHLLGGAHDLCGRWPFVEGDPLSSSVHRPSDSHPVFPMPQVSRTLDSGPARLVGLREFTRLPWLQPLPGLKDGAQPGLLCSPASTSGKEWRALGSLAHPQSGAGQAPNSSSREADVRGCESALSLHGASPGTGSQTAWCSPPLALGFSRLVSWGFGVRIHPDSLVIVYWRPACSGKGNPRDHWVERGKGSAAVVRSMSRDVLTQGREVQEVGDLCLHAGEATLSNGDCAARNTLPAWQLRKRFMRYRANTGPLSAA